MPVPELHRFGRLAGSAQAQKWGEQALQVLAPEPSAVEGFFDEVAPGADAASLRHDPRDADEGSARRLAQRMALLLQASLLARHAASPVADAFVISRLGGESGRAFGTPPRTVDVGAVLESGRGALVLRVPAAS